MNSGKLLIFLILGVALAAAGVAWRFQSQRGSRALELWGGQNAYLIRHGPLVQLTLLDTQSSLDISQARGLSHARQALIEDSSFVWSEPPEELAAAAAAWSHALRFAEADREFAIQFDLSQRLAQARPDGRRVRMAEKLATGLSAFLDELESTGAAAEVPQPIGFAGRN